jgi:hypothetical protein
MTTTLFLVIILFIVMAQRRRVPNSIPMKADKFWALVQSQDQPIVLLTTRGVFGVQLCYAFPYNGVIFRTDARGPQAPPGVRVVGTGNGFGL